MRVRLLCRGGCFCYTAEKSHHLRAQITSTNPQFQEEKISERRKVRSQVTLEKSSKNYISLFAGKPARGLPTPTPNPLHDIKHFTHGKRCKCDLRLGLLRARFTHGGEWGRAGWFAKRCHLLTDHQINCKFKTRIVNTILLLRYLNKICLSLTGGLWQASANLYSEEKL